MRALLASIVAIALAGASAAQPPAAEFTAHTIDTGLSGGYQVVVADRNRDGKPDIVAVASGLKELRWYENPGWHKHVLVTGVNQPINTAAYDVDNDGIPEIALAHEFSNVYARSLGIVSILTHDGDPRGPWSIKEIDRVPTSHPLRFADIDGSGFWTPGVDIDLGIAARISGTVMNGAWSLTVTANWATGTTRIVADARDSDGAWSGRRVNTMVTVA